MCACRQQTHLPDMPEAHEFFYDHFCYDAELMPSKRSVAQNRDYACKYRHYTETEGIEKSSRLELPVLPTK